MTLVDPRERLTAIEFKNLTLRAGNFLLSKPAGIAAAMKAAKDVIFAVVKSG